MLKADSYGSNYSHSEHFTSKSAHHFPYISTFRIAQPAISQSALPDQYMTREHLITRLNEATSDGIIENKFILGA